MILYAVLFGITGRAKPTCIFGVCATFNTCCHGWFCSWKDAPQQSLFTLNL